MNVFYDPQLLKKLKKVDVRIRKSFKQRITLFIKDPYNPHLNNHALSKEWGGYRTINVTADYRAVYREIEEINDDGETEVVAFFVALGTHKELYESE